VHSGDANQDGALTAGDVQYTFYIVMGWFIPTQPEACAADCNGNGAITASDAQNIWNLVMGTGSCADPLVRDLPGS